MEFRKIRRSLWRLVLVGMMLTVAPELFPLSAQAQTKEQIATARKAIEAAYKVESRAYNNFDVEAAMANMAQDYKHIDKKGEVTTREELQETMAFVFKYAEDIQTNTVIEKFALYGNRASVHTKTYAKVQVPGEGKSFHILTSTERSRAVWVKQGNRWMKTRDEEISFYSATDGKPDR